MVVGVASSLIASMLLLICTWLWRNRGHMFVMRTVFRPAVAVRVSMSALLRIKDDDGYVLFHTPYTPGSFGPPGGVFKFRRSAQSTLDAIAFREQRRGSHGAVMRSDLRGFVVARKLAAFLRWFESGRGRESGVECLHRELHEELAEVGSPHLREAASRISLSHVRTVVELPQRVPGQDYKQFRLIEIYEVVPDLAGTQFLEETLRLANDGAETKVVLVSSQEIIDGRHRDVLVGPQAAYLFGPRRFRQDLPPIADLPRGDKPIS